MEYAYPDAGFSIRFPADPHKTDGIYATDDGMALDARIYSAQEDGAIYTVTIADFTNESPDQTVTLDRAMKALGRSGNILLDIPARVNGQHGRQFSITGKDGSHSTGAMFLVNQKLFLIEATILPVNPDPQSGDAIRFQQSLRFTGDYMGRRFAHNHYRGRGFRRHNTVPDQAPATEPRPDEHPLTPPDAAPLEQDHS